MITRGEYKTREENYGLILSYTKDESELLLVKAGNVYSSFKKCETGEFSYGNKKAKDVWRIVQGGYKACTAKNGNAAPFVYGTVSRHTFKKAKVDYTVDKYNGEIAGMELNGEDMYLLLEYCPDENIIPRNIPYIKLTVAQEFVGGITEEESIVVRKLEEIALEKEDHLVWLNNKKYYIINDEATAERIFAYLDTYTGPISYDTETTGLKINMFSKVNSEWQRKLKEYNDKQENAEDKIRSDKLVGFIFAVEPNVAYYFPVANRKFKNLYEGASPITYDTINKVRAQKQLDDPQCLTDMGKLFRDTPNEALTPDVIAMERIRRIIEKGHIVAHNGAFEWKVDWCYDIDTNLKDDTMILHQLMYKFRSTTSNKGEPSKLKYLEKREFGIDSLELTDFFPELSEDDTGEVKGKSKKKKKKGSKIDFSYMDYEGARPYACADGDWTLQLFFKYKRDLIENHKELEYLYSVEVLVACAIGYMEFYGHRIDEDKIEAVKTKSKLRMLEIEHEIRVIARMHSDDETGMYDELLKINKELSGINSDLVVLNKQLNNTTNEADIVTIRAGIDKKKDEMVSIEELQREKAKELKSCIDSSDKVINLASPAQVAKLLFHTLEIPFDGEKLSVAKNVVKPLLQAKNEDGSIKYPVVHLYSEYKRLDTLLTKFFDNLPNFMYPGGYIFSSYGQITTATGRMSCSKPNAQQYPKDITDIVVGRPGYVLLDADYSQIEYRTLVAMANEPALAAQFEDPDNDYHTMMASIMYGVPYASVTPKMRGDAKSFNFGIPYGMGFNSLAILLTGMCGPAQVEEAKVKYELYFKDQPNVRRFFDQVKEMALVNKFTKTFWNRYRYYSFVDKDGNVSHKKKGMALRQAGNAVIQGTAADIFKISVARNFMYIRRNKLIGELLIINMIHDEQLFEINCQKLHPQRILRDVVENMQFKVQGFPPLYVGAGLGVSWKSAKSKDNEIHPFLCDQLSKEVEGTSIFLNNPIEVKTVLEYFDKRVYEFRRTKIINYILDSNNYGKDLHPAIGNLLNLQFTYGLGKSKNNPEGLEGDALTFASVAKFIEVNQIDVDPNNFKTSNGQVVEVEEDKEYEDEDEENMDELGEFNETNFALIDEDDTLYGVSLQEVIGIFGLVVSNERRICGIDSKVISYKKKDELVDYLLEHRCEKDDEGSMQVIFLQENNVLFTTGIWVKAIDGSAVAGRLRLNTVMYQ